MEAEHHSLKYQAGSPPLDLGPGSHLCSHPSPCPQCLAPCIIWGLIEGTPALLIFSRRARLAGFLCNPGPAWNNAVGFCVCFFYYFLGKMVGSERKSPIERVNGSRQKEGSRACRLARLAGQNSCEKGSADFPTPAGAAVAKAPLERGHPRVLIYTQPTSSFRVHLFSTQRRGDANFTVNLLKPGTAIPLPALATFCQGKEAGQKQNVEEKKKGGGRNRDSLNPSKKKKCPAACKTTPNVWPGRHQGQGKDAPG